MNDTHALDVFTSPLAGTRLIEASAGTGKTWNICGLYLRLLLEQRLTVQQILVVTFTKAATAELRERIRHRIVDLLAGLRTEPCDGAAADPFVAGLLARLRQGDGGQGESLGLTDAEAQRLLEQALQTFDEAAIFTIHGFCQRALADTPFAARLPLVQELLQDDSALRLEAVHDFWRAHVAGPQADPSLVAHLLACGDNPDHYARLLQRQLGRPLSQLVWPEGIETPFDPAAASAAVVMAFDAAQALWQAGPEAVTDTLLAGLKQLNGNTYRRDGVLLAQAGWQAVLDAAQPPASPQSLPPKLALFGSGLLAARVKKSLAPPTHAFFDAAQTLLEALTTQQTQLALARLRLLRQLLTEGADQLREAKQRRRVVAFDDMLFNLHQRLSDGHGAALAAALLKRFPAALIDEFQDTDPLQFAVFQAIYGVPPAAGQPAPPLCLVGDPKQAIYSFRHADLHTYLRARALASARYTLLANQRSSPPLIHALNRLFGLNPRAFMQPGLAYHAVAKGVRSQPPLHDATEPRAALQVWTLPRDARSGQPLAKADALAAAAQVCAGEIARLLTAAAAGGITLDARPLRAGDIAVLVRTHAQGSLVRQALAGLCVGSVELSQASVFTSPDAEDVERVLAAMLEPAREGLLKAALATRWFGFDARQIDALANDEPALSALLQRFVQYQALWRGRGVGFLLRQWLQQERVAQRLLAAPDGARRLTNLLHLAECLHQAATEHPSPEALLRWLQAQRSGGASGDDTTQLRLESDRNLVQIVTIHKSKGLEYPVVFCPFLFDGRLRPAGDGLEGAARHDEDGAAVIDFRDGLDPAYDADAAKAEARQEAAAETMRLVYVALTRAVHRCYLVAGSYRQKAGRHWSTRESATSGLNWLVAGGDLLPGDWLAPKRALPEPAALDAAWAALAAVSALAGAATREALAIGVAPLPTAWRQPLPPRADGSGPLQALPPPGQLGRAWWIGSYSALVHGAAAGFIGAEGLVAANGPVGLAETARPSDRPTDAGRFDPADPAIDLLSLARERAATDRAAADHDLRAEPDEPAPWGVDGPPPEAVAASAPRPALSLAADDILGFPRGAVAGECVHAAFEWAEFTDPGSWPAAAARALQQHPPSTDTAGSGHAQVQLQRVLADVLQTPLPLGTAQPLRLAELPANRRLAELEFHLPVPHLAVDALVGLLHRLGYAAPTLEFRNLHGYLKGFIDLVFEHDGRFFIADWKSNHLGNSPADYGPAPLAAAMAQHHYHLQYLLYSVALHRWLQRRLPDYHYDRHVGGVAYLFVRGLRPGWRDAHGQPTGLFFHRPSADTITQLSALLGDERPGP